MATYGAGTWADWLRVRHPDDLASEARRQLSEAASSQRDDDFLPFADSIDGDVLGWVRVGPPDRWPVAWVPRHSDPGRAVQRSFTEVLLAWLRGYEVDDVFASPDPDADLVDQATFQPFRQGHTGERAVGPAS